MSRWLQLMRIAQLVGGFAIFLLGYWMWLYVWFWDVSVGNKTEFSGVAIIFLMLALPGLFVAVGSYLQTLHEQIWAVVLVGIGIVGTVTFVGKNAYFLFGYTADKWGLRAVFTDLALVVLMLPLAVLNAVFQKPRPLKRVLFS